MGNKSSLSVMAPWKLVISQLSLLCYQMFRAAERKLEKLWDLTSCRWWTRVVKAVFACIGLSTCIRRWDLKAGHGILRRRKCCSVLFISWPLLIMSWRKALNIFHWGTHWNLAGLHAHGGFLCQVWFCTFTLLSLLTPLQPWFCSQAFSRACRTSCVLDLSGFGCRCQDASNKKNYQVTRSKQIKKQLCFTQCIDRLFSLLIVWKWTSVQKAIEHVHEIIQSRTIKHKDTASHSRDPWSRVGRLEGDSFFILLGADKFWQI